MEKHYSIDPGKGTKMEGCPYSFYEDGHDVREFIIPPRGYAFTGFRFEPLPNNQIYDGKLVAEYEKVSVHDRLTSNLWKALIPISITTVISVVALLAVSIFREPTPEPPRRYPQPIAAADTTKPIETPEKAEPSKPQEPLAKQEPAKKPEAPAATKPETKPENPEAPKPETKPETPAVPKPETKPEQQPALPTTQQPTKPETETPQAAANDLNAQFKDEFWSLIHKREPKMDSYHNLYVNNKGKVKGEEYDYLRFVILENTKAFKEWYSKLKAMPDSQLQNINSVAGLRHAIH